MRRELVLRLTIGPLLAGTAIACLAWDFASGSHYGLLLLLAMGLALGGRELRRMAHEVAGPVQIMPTVVVNYLLVVVAFVKEDPGAHGWFMTHGGGAVHQRIGSMPLEAVMLSLGLVWTVIIQMRRRAWERFFTNVALTIFGMVYLGLTTYLMLRLAMLSGSAEYYLGADAPAGAPGYANRGNQLLLLFLASCKLGDVTAYFGGRATGRHKMAPVISPGKTWEGFAFSFVGSIGGAYIFEWIFTRTCAHGAFNGWWQPLVWGLVIGPLGVAGDLAESCMKREAARKDSGTSVPGFGGWLDVFDALVLAAPMAYVLGLVL